MQEKISFSTHPQLFLMNSHLDYKYPDEIVWGCVDSMIDHLERKATENL